MLPSTPPKSIAYSIKKGDAGWQVYALQCALNSVRVAVNGAWEKLAIDGDFGPGTEGATKTFQKAYGLTADAIAGPASQSKLIALMDTQVHAMSQELPDGLMRGWVEGEGANVLAATNWSVAGGVDCGVMQYRVYGPPYSMDRLKSAFDPMASMVMGGLEMLARAEDFATQPGVKNRKDKVEFSKRLSILAHNWPAGAADIARDGSLFNPTGTASWVPAGVKFPDGQVVNTRWEWCQYYAMGRGDFPGMIPKYVKDWS